MRECQIEKSLRIAVDKQGGLCVKLSPMNYVGIPDRLVILPGGVIIFCEVKKPRNSKIARLQYWWRERLLGLGCRHEFILTKDDVDNLLGEIP
jgi:hypothetical protein